MSPGYEATMKLAVERPELLPLLRLIHDLGDEGFNEALDELTRRGIIRAFVRHYPPASQGERLNR